MASPFDCDATLWWAAASRRARRTTRVTLQDAEVAFGLRPLPDRAQLPVDDGERIVPISRIDSGRSSLLQAIGGDLSLDDGEVRWQAGVRIVRVEQ